MGRTEKYEPVLVTGATGRQGGATARALLARGFRVRVLTRDPEKPEALALSKLGAEVAHGDMDNPSTLEAALRDARGVFSVQNFWEAGYDGEIRQGRVLVDAARDAGVGHFVQSSVGGADRDSGVAHFECKWEVEKYLRTSGLPRTVLRPAAFMDDWEEMRGEILSGALALPLPPEARLQQIAVEDVGSFAAMAFGRPEEWIGREVELAGDELAMSEMAETFSEVSGRPVRYEHFPLAEFRREFGEDLATMFVWFKRAGYEADVAALRREHPGLLTLEGYLRRHSWDERDVGRRTPEAVGREDAE